jgi:hypothetical protein
MKVQLSDKTLELKHSRHCIHKEMVQSIDRLGVDELYDMIDVEF